MTRKDIYASWVVLAILVVAFIIACQFTGPI